MNVIVVSNHTIIREGIVAIISKYDDMHIQFIGQSIKEAMFEIRKSITDVILWDLHKEDEEEINAIRETLEAGINIKTLVLDFYGDNELFVRALKHGVKGYILGKSTEDEIIYAIDQIYIGKKYYDSFFIDKMISSKTDVQNNFEILTAREKEILIEVAYGLSNHKISEKFLISENTVKKHINHIFEKLNIHDRTEATLYVNKYVVVNK